MPQCFLMFCRAGFARADFPGASKPVRFDAYRNSAIAALDDLVAHPRAVRRQREIHVPGAPDLETARVGSFIRIPADRLAFGGEQVPEPLSEIADLLAKTVSADLGVLDLFHSEAAAA